MELNLIWLWALDVVDGKERGHVDCAMGLGCNGHRYGHRHDISLHTFHLNQSQPPFTSQSRPSTTAHHHHPLQTPTRHPIGPSPPPRTNNQHPPASALNPKPLFHPSSLYEKARRMQDAGGCCKKEKWQDARKARCEQIDSAAETKRG